MLKNSDPRWAHKSRHVGNGPFGHNDPFKTGGNLPKAPKSDLQNTKRRIVWTPAFFPLDPWRLKKTQVDHQTEAKGCEPGDIDAPCSSASFAAASPASPSAWVPAVSRPEQGPTWFSFVLLSPKTMCLKFCLAHNWVNSFHRLDLWPTDFLRAAPGNPVGRLA